jgi:hypothetical protein
VRRTRDLGGQTDSDGTRATTRDRVPTAASPSREEEAVLIAERLTALVESRRAGAASDAAALPSARPSAPAVGGVVGARHTGRLLGNLLLTRGFLVETELQYALARQASTGDPIGQILVDLGLITDRDLVELLAEQMRMEVIVLARLERDPATLSLLSKDAASRLAVLPLRRVDGQIEVAVADPTDEGALEELMRLLGAPLRLFLATRADIDAAIERFYG